VIAAVVPHANDHQINLAGIPGSLSRNPKEFVDGSLIERLKQEKLVEGLKL
jgi:hypothetical protein